MASISRSRSRAIAKASLAVAIAACIAQTASAEVLGITSDQQSSAAVGEVSLVLGRAYVQAPDGSRQQLSSGSQVHARDRIFTETNGHVHIRFIDQALVSVRPDSALEIVQYDYNADQPRLSSIKLNLQEGVTRSISGHGASSARERFRLNTPIAAIGVRGTDFVVSATDRTVRALVNEGSIVLAPFSSECTADSFGPCADNAIELSGSALQMIEYGAGSSSPRLLSSEAPTDSEVLNSNIMRVAVETAAHSEEKTVGTDAYLENVTAPRVQAGVAASEVIRPPVVVVPPAPVLTDRNLVWGRHNDGLNALSVPLATAAAGRDVAVNSGTTFASDYTLYRDGNGAQRVQASVVGPLNFTLAHAQASYSSASGVVAMTIGSGALAINFDNNSFATSLNMSHELTGAVNFATSGLISREGGYFFTRSANEQLRGAVSLDGKEAGYYFEMQLQSGGIQGLTLWDKR